MCGILGACGSFDEQSFRRSLDMMRHRGPDDYAVEMHSVGRYQVQLGHTRLAVLDVTPRGHQPMCSPEGRVRIIYNGEIYNFRELRQKYLSHVDLRSDSDTEVLLNLYLCCGMEMLEYLEGMYAFAVLDETERRIYFARDAFGIKPFLYAHGGGEFIFGSELTPIRRLWKRTGSIDRQALFHYLSFFFFPDDTTAYTQIRELRPGHFGFFDLSTGHMEISKFERSARSQCQFGSREEAEEALRNELRASVRAHLAADVPVGVFLSGGVDSAALVAYAAEASAGPVDTFTATLSGAGAGSSDESAQARRMAARYGTRHHEIPINMKGGGQVLDLLKLFGQPFGNSTYYLSYLISRATKEHVTVALSGAGGDELFGGYPRYRALGVAPLLNRLPKRVGNLLLMLLARFRSTGDDNLRRRIQVLCRGIGLNRAEQYLTWTYFFNQAEKTSLLRRDFLVEATEGSESLVEELIESQEFGRAFFDADRKFFLPYNILEYTDRTSMAVSLEVRVPFLTQRLLDLSRSVPTSWHASWRGGKKLLSAVVKPLMPPENRRHPKVGFCPPLADWMRKSFDEYLTREMTPQVLDRQGVLDWRGLQRLRSEFSAGTEDHSEKLFGLIAFHEWWKRWIAEGLWQ